MASGKADQNLKL